MIKTLLITSQLLSTFVTSIGYCGNFVHQGLYSSASFVQGIGRTNLDALSDAESAIPNKNGNDIFIKDAGNSPAIDCSNRAWAPRSESDGSFRCDYEDPDSLVSVTIPIIRVTKK